MNIIFGDKPTRQELQALMRLRQPDNAAVVELLGARLETLKGSLVSVENFDHMRRQQGAAKLIQDLLEAIEKAPEVLDRLK